MMRAHLASLLLWAWLGVPCQLLAQTSGGCSVDVWRVKSRHEPVLAVGSSLVLPDRDDGELKLKRGATLTAACPGSGNSLWMTGRPQYANATCTSAGTLQVSRLRVTAGDLWCENRALADVRPTGRRCGPRGALRIFELGFNASSRWLPVISVCHDANAMGSLYAQHQLLGSLLRFRRQQTQSRPTFGQGCETGVLFRGVSPAQAYSQASVKKALTAALGSEERAAEVLGSTTISRGHLAPSADFILNTQQHASFFYVNTAPQWQIFNEGNWLSLESALRNYAQQEALDLLVWTGNHGVLSLNDSSGRARELYLAEGERMAMPQFFWKIVQEPQSGRAVAFVGLNDPFATGSAAADSARLLCPDVCAEAGWGRRKWQRPSKGFVWCCSAEDLVSAVPGAPRVNATGLLSGPKASS